MVIFIILLEAALIWVCLVNRQKFARRMFFWGVAMLGIVDVVYAFTQFLYYQNIFEGDYCGWFLFVIVVGVMAAFAGLLGLLCKKNWGRWLVAVFFGVLAVFASWILYLNSPVSRIALSDHRYCTIRFHQLYPGNGLLSYYDNSVRVGTVRLASGWFEHPWAVFPGPDGQSVICLSLLDTTYAAFTVDLAQPDSQGMAIPFKLQEAVDRSDFKVRACTRKEVNYVADLIKTADSNRLANYCGDGFMTPEIRNNLATFLLYATTANSWRDPVLRNARPQLIPEGEPQYSH
jgi:hypothetical protein